jgi:endonuclease/exonuclease/phosphatase family metal-dependent hydrolase
MKRIILALSAVLLAVSAMAQNAADVSVMSFNIRGENETDGTNSWSYRYVAVAMMLEQTAADLVCIQEATLLQLQYFADLLSKTKWVGVGRDDGKKAGEYTAFLYNTKELSVGKSGTFWLSETPDKASSGWGADHPCSAVWAIFKEKKSGKSFFVVNTHIDVDDPEYRKQAIDLILQKIDALNTGNLPVVLTGGFNMEDGDDALSAVKARMQNARSAAFSTDDVRTYHNYGKVSQKIDHIYFSGFSSCQEFKTITERFQDRAYISDHNPIQATFVL